MTHPTTAELIRELEAANAKRTQGRMWRESHETPNGMRQLIKYDWDDVPTWLAESSAHQNSINNFEFFALCATRMPEILARLRRLEEVEAIVAKLDKTIDGVPYFDGDTVWHPKLGECVVKYDVLPGCGGAWGFLAWSESARDSAWPMDCYSTEAAARAAARSEHDG